MPCRVGLRARPAIGQFAAHDLAAKNRRRRAGARFSLFAASHLGVALRPAFIAHKPACQALAGERENDEYGSKMLQHAFRKLKV